MNRHDDARIFRRDFDFSADATDQDVDGSVIGRAVMAADMVDQLVTTEDAAGIPGQGKQQFKFKAGQADIFTSRGGQCPARYVQTPVRKMDDGLILPEFAQGEGAAQQVLLRANSSRMLKGLVT